MKSLVDCIARDDSSALQPFAHSDAQLKWMQGFKWVFIPKELSSHALAKQIFFPVNDNEYHLLSPLYPSSLMQVLYQRVGSSRYGESAKETRKAKKDKKYSSNITVDYPNWSRRVLVELINKMFPD